MTSDRFTIDPDITRAETLPGWVYCDPAVYERARERVFARSWQFVGDSDLAKTPSHVHPFTFLEGCVDEPMLLSRDAKDELRCLSNVCTHRGTTVIAEPCRAAHLRCPYHGRRFALDGTFEHMPEFERTQNFPSKRDDLARLSLASIPWAHSPLKGGASVPSAGSARFHFAAIQPAFPFEELTRDMLDRVGWMPLEKFLFDPSRSRDYLVRCNWALYVENYLEGFHIPFVHALLNAALDYGEYATELFARSNLQLGLSKGGEHAFDPPRSSPDKDRKVAAYYWWLWPNMMFNFYPWGLSINIVRPQAVDRTRVSFLTYVWDESKMEQGAGAGLDRVEREDEVVVEAVQRGVRSRVYTRGRYSPTREQGVHHFHRMLADALAG
jgi:choline monooxygenase